MSIELKPCSFCGADPHDARHIEYGRWAVTCRCGASGVGANTGPNATDAAKIKAYQDARSAWNTRTAIQQAEAQQPTAGEPVAKAWEEGYRQGMEDERTSNANIGIAGFGAKVDPARQNPYRDAARPAPSVPDPIDPPAEDGTEYESTPPEFAAWLVELARGCAK